MSMLSSGKVHLKRAKNKAPVRKEEQPPLVLPRNILRRQITLPNPEKELLASLEDSPYSSVKPTVKEVSKQTNKQTNNQSIKQTFNLRVLMRD